MFRYHKDTYTRCTLDQVPYKMYQKIKNNWKSLFDVKTVLPETKEIDLGFTANLNCCFLTKMVIVEETSL